MNVEHSKMICRTKEEREGGREGGGKKKNAERGEALRLMKNS